MSGFRSTEVYQAKFWLVILDVLLTETKKMFLCVKRVKTLYRTGRTCNYCM